MSNKRQKMSFLGRSFCQYPSTFKESDKTRWTKATNILNPNDLLCYNSKNYTTRDFINSSKYCKYQIMV